MSKFKLVIHPRLEGESAPQSMTIEEIIESAAADWDPEDPGVGKAVLLPDGREIFNPVPFAPPVGYQAEPTMMELMQRMLRRELMQAKDDEAVDSLEEMNDFPEDEERPFHSFYELQLMEEFPESPPLPEPGEAPPPPPPPPPADPAPAPPPEPPKA